MTNHTPQTPVYFRNFLFGVEDSLVSTVGLLSGIAMGGVERETILLTGVVLIFVEALSMAAGSFLVESSVEEYTHVKNHNEGPAGGGVVMFVSYVIAGLIPLTPYIFTAAPVATYISVLASLLALFVLGVIGGSLSHKKVVQRGLRMMIIGGVAIVTGVAAGLVFGL